MGYFEKPVRYLMSRLIIRRAIDEATQSIVIGGEPHKLNKFKSVNESSIHIVQIRIYLIFFSFVGLIKKGLKNWRSKSSICFRLNVRVHITRLLHAQEIIDFLAQGAYTLIISILKMC